MNQVKRLQAIHNNHLLPSFFILGERKCGTSSLFRYLCAHSHIVPGKLKEPNFFVRTQSEIDAQWDRYAALFPTVQQERSKLMWPELNEVGILYEEEVEFAAPESGKFITGEASANTLSDADPAVVTKMLPQCQFIIVLRDPVSRAYSHFRMLRRFQDEGRDIGFNLQSWPSQVNWEINKIRHGEYAPILSPSLYLQSLLRWDPYWRANPPIILGTHELTENRLPDTLSYIFQRLGLDYENIAPDRYNQAPPASMSSQVENQLRSFFQPYNERLFDYLKKVMPWA